MNLLENIFKLDEHNTDIKTEFLAGITTFFTMSYLFILCPKLLSIAGLDFNSTLTANSVAIFIFSLLMAFIANRPYTVAPLLGECAFVAYTLVSSSGLSVQTVLAAIMISGILLFVMSFFNLREYIVNKIPETIKISFCVGLGLFFIYIALRDMGIVEFTKNSIPVQFGNFTDPHLLLSLFCFVLLIVLLKRNIKGAILIAIITTTVLGILIRDIQLPEKIISVPFSITPSLFQLDFSGLLHKSFLPVFFVIFLLINIDTSGSLIGIIYNTEYGKTDVDLKRPMIADSLAVTIAPMLGLTTPGVFLDSMTGIKEGGKTGLTSIITGLLFLLGLLFTPIICLIPSYAYAPVLLYVGLLITTVISKLKFYDITEFAPALFIISTMIFTYNIGAGIILGFLIYPIIKIMCGQKKQTNPILWTLSALSLLYFIFYKY